MDEVIKFRQYLINEEKSDATVEKYVRDVTRFLERYDGKLITKEIVLDYKKHLIENYSPASVNSIISSLNSYFCFCNRYELRLKALKIQRQLFCNKDRELTKQEYERLLRTAQKKGNERLYLIMQTICSSGIRVGELQWITVDAVKDETAVIRCKGKIRSVFLPEKLCRKLKQYAKKNGITNGSVFVTKFGKPINRSNIWKMLKGLCDSAGVSREKVFPHNLRHLFARTFYSIEKDIVRLADILGHSSIEITRIYTIETGETHRKKIQKLGLLLC